MLEAVFEFLFKYRPLIYERGDVQIGGFGTGWLIVGLMLAGIAASLLYVRVRGKTTGRDRIVLLILRASLLGVLALMLFRPRLVLSTVVPQQNFLGVLIDDSRSMQVGDMDERNRSDVAVDLFGANSNLFQTLSEQFVLRTYRFSDQAVRVADAGAMNFEGVSTDLGSALDRARQDMSGVPLAGLVMITDGADNSGEGQTEALISMQEAGVPVYVVGLGREEFERDISLGRVETPRTVLRGSALAVELPISQRGFRRGQEVRLLIEDNGRIISEQTVELPGDGDVSRVTVLVDADEAGPRVFRFRIPVENGEMVEQNNAQEALVVVRDRVEKILYFEGEPRYELKFLKRAVEEDDNLRVVTLIRTADEKFYARDVEDAEELAAGFPATREKLFSYRGLILGSVEASFFTRDQLRMISDFVSERGGGLLVLGGQRSLGPGGYAGTPLEDALPVVIDGNTPADFFESVQVGVTPTGFSHPITQIAETPEASRDRWSSLPPLSILSPLQETKPGAVTLLTGRSTSGDDHVVFAYQRYGRGRSAVLGVQDSWIWQMHADMPLEDQTHEEFWQQSLRWLISGVPEQVTARPEEHRIQPGGTLDLIAEVEDDRFLRLNNTEVRATVTDPLGGEQQVSMDWTVQRDGEYSGSAILTERGIHTVVVDAYLEGSFLGTDTTFIEVADLDREFHGAEMQAASLERLAAETGGRFYTTANVDQLPEDIRFTDSGTTVIEERDLWDLPILFILVVGLMSSEWGYRRLRGLA